MLAHTPNNSPIVRPTVWPTTVAHKAQAGNFSVIDDVLCIMILMCVLAGSYCIRRYNVIYVMCPFSGDGALQLTRKHAACTSGVRTKDRDIWTSQSSITNKRGTFFVCRQNDSTNP
jgi:hypothetical protein